ncbi:MAG: AmmeMemoRadiSam system protein B, partial [Gammaproteobacteria bacterium]
MHNSHNNPQIRQGRPSETVKQPAVAGLFYPENPAELQTMLDDFMDNTVVTTAPPKALIVPHAGYVYSGSVAASGYAMLIPDRHKIKRVVLMGPAHRVYLQGVAI